MGEEDGTVQFYQPDKRALFPITGAHVSRSMAKLLRRAEFSITFDTAFEQVMRSCRRPEDNWINEPIIRAFTQCHAQGWGHSCEVWQEGRLVGGIYGVALGTCFSAESMFHAAPNASKVALITMINRCRELGFEIFDAQVMNPHLARMGAYEVSLASYLRSLERCQTKTTVWSNCPYR